MDFSSDRSRKLSAVEDNEVGECPECGDPRAASGASAKDDKTADDLALKPFRDRDAVAGLLARPITLADQVREFVRTIPSVFRRAVELVRGSSVEEVAEMQARIGGEPQGVSGIRQAK